MSSPPAMRPANTSGAVRAAGELRPWEVRSADGRHLVMRLTQPQAEQAYGDGRVEVIEGRHGRYLRAVSRSGSPSIGRYTGPKSTSGHAAAALGNPGALYRHSEAPSWRPK